MALLNDWLYSNAPDSVMLVTRYHILILLKNEIYFRIFENRIASDVEIE